jgi:hypothetical protein
MAVVALWHTLMCLAIVWWWLAPQVTSGANYGTRGNFHYRSGLNAIPLIEWFIRNPDDVFLLEPALGAVAGQVRLCLDIHFMSFFVYLSHPHVQRSMCLMRLLTSCVAGVRVYACACTRACTRACA